MLLSVSHSSNESNHSEFISFKTVIILPTHVCSWKEGPGILGVIASDYCTEHAVVGSLHRYCKAFILGVGSVGRGRGTSLHVPKVMIFTYS